MEVAMSSVAPAPAAAGSAGENAPKGATGGRGGRDTGTKPKPGTLTVAGGRRELKVYTVTADELWMLGIMQGLATLFFAGFSFLLSFWLTTKQTIDLSGTSSPETARAKWEAWGEAAGYGSIALAFFGIVFLVLGGLKVLKVINGTKHD